MSKVFLLAIFLLTAPSLANVLFSTESTGIWVIFLLAGYLLFTFVRDRIYISQKLIFFLLIIGLWNFISLVSSPYRFELYSSLSMYLGIIVLFVSANVIARRWSGISSEAVINDYLRTVHYSCIVCVAVSFFAFTTNLNLPGLSYFPFAEPAHFARFLGIVIMCVVASSLPLIS